MKEKILPLGDPRLRAVCSEVTNVFDPEFVLEAKRLKATLDEFRAEKGFGRGIAAPQIGIKKRFIAVNLGEGTRCLINPVIIDRCEETFTLWDDCMCFPDLLVKVRRNKSIGISYVDEEGRRQIRSGLGAAESELLQHEIDHLGGVLAIDLAEGVGGIIYRIAYDADPDYFRAQVDYVISPTTNRGDPCC